MKNPALPLSRRGLLATAGATALTAGLGLPARLAAQDLAPHLELGDAEAFSFEGLAAQAQALAEQAYAPRSVPDPEIVQAIDYDAHGRLRFIPNRAPHAEGPG